MSLTRLALAVSIIGFWILVAGKSVGVIQFSHQPMKSTKSQEFLVGTEIFFALRSATGQEPSVAIIFRRGLLRHVNLGFLGAFCRADSCAGGEYADHASDFFR